MGYGIVRVGTEKIQERFEEEGLRYPEDFGIVVVEAASGAPGKDAPDDLPPGSTSVELSYRRGDDFGEEVARAHVYKRPDGSFRGTPDPKRLLVDDAIWVLDRDLDLI